MAFKINPEKFPYVAFFVLLSSGFASGLALTGLFPYVAFMMVDLGAAVSVDKAGYVSGYVASAFMVGRLLTSFYWGRVADQIGRKPVFYIACVSVAASSVVFGFSVNMFMAIVSRIFLGLMNPTVGLIKTVVSELCAQKDQAFAMSVVSASWSIGLVVGPSLGGWTSRPAVQYPNSTLGQVPLFVQFPYLLPNLLTAAFSLVSLVMIHLYLPETLASRKSKQPYEAVSITEDEPEGVILPNEQPGPALNTSSASIGEENRMESNVDSDDDIEMLALPMERTEDDIIPSADEKSNGEEGEDSGFLASIVELLRIESVRVAMIAYFVMSYMAIVYDEIVPLWALSSKSKGGLEYMSKDVGLLISFTGVPMIIFTLFLFPPIAKKLGYVQGFRIGQFLFAFFSVGVMCAPLLHSAVLPESFPLLPVLLVMTSFAKMASTMAFTCIFLIINASVPSHLRGSVNGLAMTFGSVSKALGPTFGSIIFAWSIHSSLPLPVSYMFVFLLNFAMAVFTLFLPTSSFADGLT